MKVNNALFALAEEILDEMIEAESSETGDYELFVAASSSSYANALETGSSFVDCND